MSRKVREEVRSDVNYLVYAFNTLDAKEIAYNIPEGTSDEIKTVLEEDFGIESRKIEEGVHADYLRKSCTY